MLRGFRRRRLSDAVFRLRAVARRYAPRRSAYAKDDENARSATPRRRACLR